MKKNLLSALFLLAFASLSSAISLSTLNTFEDGTAQEWQVGGAGLQPANQATGGPAGSGDHFLQVVSDGSAVNGRFVFFNMGSEWTGDWTTAGITFVNFYVNNISGAALTLRVAVDGDGGKFCTTIGKSISMASGWVQVSIPVNASDFTSVSGTSIATTLSSVNTVRILSNSSIEWRGAVSMNTVGFDNIAASNVMLPVELTAFSGTLKGNNVDLFWQTATESNNFGFEVEHSNDGKKWSSLGQLRGKGNSVETQNYRFTDVLPAEGVNYYRLKQTDFDGRYAYSWVVSVVKGKNQKDFALFPNPSFGSTVNLQFLATNNGSAQLQVMDMAGKIVLAQSLFVQQGNETYPIDISSLGKGVYIFQLKMDGKLSKNKMILR